MPKTSWCQFVGIKQSTSVTAVADTFICFTFYTLILYFRICSTLLLCYAWHAAPTAYFAFTIKWAFGMVIVTVSVIIYYVFFVSGNSMLSLWVIALVGLWFGVFEWVSTTALRDSYFSITSPIILPKGIRSLYTFDLYNT